MSFPIGEPIAAHDRLEFMLLNFAWLLLGLSGTVVLNSLALTSDFLGVVLPQVTFAIAFSILFIGTKIDGLGFFRDMISPALLGVFYIIRQPLAEMAVLPLIVGVWLGLANHFLRRPVALVGFIGQSSLIASAGLLFWRHLERGLFWTMAGLFCYAILSHRPSSRRTLPCW